MQFHSLTNPAHTASFQQGVEWAVPPGGGLYVPSHVPKLSPDQLKELMCQDDPAEIAFLILRAWLHDELSEANLREVVRQAGTFPIPIRQVGNKLVLELFHGPTGAFKDVAAQYLAAFLAIYAVLTGVIRTVIVATSGDTFGAIAKAFGNVPGTRVIGLWPKGRVTAVQTEQLTRVAPNITSLEVAGSFDDCQKLAITALSDPDFAGAGLTSANSISVGRLIPQMIYYALASLGIASMGSRPLRFVVPSGNLGNLTAGVLAQQMGLPISRFLAANNRNNPLYRYIETGDRSLRLAERTFSNAMDVGVPNNLARLDYLFGGRRDILARTVAAVTISDERTVSTIQEVYAESGYVLDPHTAVAWAASEELPRRSHRDIIVSTAAPQKFAAEIMERCGLFVDNQAMLDALRVTPQRYQSIPADYDAFKSIVAATLQTGA